MCVIRYIIFAFNIPEKIELMFFFIYVMEILTNDDIVRHIMIYADIRAIMNMRMVARIVLIH